MAHGVAQAGFPTVLLGSLIPEKLETLPARRWIGEIHYLLLYYSDEARRQRIERRPLWRSRDIDKQVEFGRWLRCNIDDHVDTERNVPGQAARPVSDWVIERL